MRCRPMAFVAVVCVGALGGTALAADRPAAPPPLPPAPALPVDFAGGLYVRIDGGVGFNNTPSLSISPSPVGLPAASLGDPNYRGKFVSSTFPHQRISDGSFGDVGVGYSFGNYFRVDVTGEYRGGMDLSAVNVLNDRGSTVGPFGALNASNSLVTVIKGQLSSAIFLANGYVDLGSYWGITPFVGAGIGAARNYSSGMKETAVFTARVGNFAPISAPVRGFLDNKAHTAVAWALMAGAAYDIAPNLKLEVGYRYMDYGRLQTGNESILLPNGGAAKQIFSGRSRDLVSNDVKVGLRWSFNAGPPLQEPLSRRY